MRREGIRLSTGEKARIDFELAVGDVREQVTVTADAPMLRAETASLGTVVEHEQVVQLPLNGRTFIMLAALAPGVALPPNSQLPRINGGRPRTNEYLFDGISVLQPEPGQVAFFPVDRRDSGVQDREQQSARRVRPLQRRRGEPDDQGRDERLSRRRLRVPPQRGAQREEFLSVDEPGEAGLPAQSVRRHARRAAGRGTARSSSSDYQGQRQSIGRTVDLHRADVLQRQGIFTEAIGGRVPVIYDPATTIGSARTPFPGNAIPLGHMDPVALALLQRYPLPTSSGTANNYSRTESEIDDQDQWDVRIDHKFPSNRDQAVRPALVFPRRVRAGHAAAGRQRRHDRARWARRTRRRGRLRRTTSTPSRPTC